MTRRSFGLTVLSACVAGSARAGGATKWALLSDTHISKAEPTTNPYVLDAKPHLAAVVASIDNSFDGMLICGDAAQWTDGGRATADDYVTLKSYTDKAKVRRKVVAMGNTDDSFDYLKVFGRPEKMAKLSGQVVVEVDSDPVRLVILDSSSGSDSPYTSATLGAAQLSWLQKYLGDHHDKPVILFSHWPVDERFPIDKNSPSSGKPMIEDGFLAACVTPNLGSIVGSDRHKSVKAVITGHHHKWSYKEENGIHFLSLPSVAITNETPMPYNWGEPGRADGAGWAEVAFEKNGFTVTPRGIPEAGNPNAGNGSGFLPWRR